MDRTINLVYRLWRKISRTNCYSFKRKVLFYAEFLGYFCFNAIFLFFFLLMRNCLLKCTAADAIFRCSWFRRSENQRLWITSKKIYHFNFLVLHGCIQIIYYICRILFAYLFIWHKFLCVFSNSYIKIMLIKCTVSKNLVI